MRVLIPTIRDPGQIGGMSTHLQMLSSGLEESGHSALVLYLGGVLPRGVGKTAIVWPAGALNRVRRGWGMVYAAAVRGRLLAALTERELKRARADGEPWEVLNAQDVYSVPALRAVADRYGIPLVLTLHGYPLYESMSEGYSRASAAGRSFLMESEIRALRLADSVVTVDSRLHRHVLRISAGGGVPHQPAHELHRHLSVSSGFRRAPRAEGCLGRACGQDRALLSPPSGQEERCRAARAGFGRHAAGSARAVPVVVRGRRRRKAGDRACGP